MRSVSKNAKRRSVVRIPPAPEALAASTPLTITDGPFAETKELLGGRQLVPLNRLVGRWITEGETISDGNSIPIRVLGSDLYEWAPGGRFLVHHSMGRVGDVDIGSVEIIGYDRATHHFRAQRFDSCGNVSARSLTYHDATWTWLGDHTRCTGVLGDGGRTLLTKHEHTDERGVWLPSMQVIQWKVD